MIEWFSFLNKRKIQNVFGIFGTRGKNSISGVQLHSWIRITTLEILLLEYVLAFATKIPGVNFFEMYQNTGVS